MSGVAAQQYPGLAHLLGAYLHQDFALYGGTLADAVRAFASDDGPDAAAAARADIARLLHDHPQASEAAVRAVEPGCARPPGMAADAYLHWLDRLLAAAAQSHGHAAE